jgi:K+-sensing histidine kinase KdpD
LNTRKQFYDKKNSSSFIGVVEVHARRTTKAKKTKTVQNPNQIKYRNNAE